MTTYIMLIDWTDQGLRGAKDSPGRIDAARAMLEEMGGTFRELYMTLGAHDFVAVIEAPDDAVAARFALLLSAQGNVRTRTLKAFPEAASREILRSLG